MCMCVYIIFPPLLNQAYAKALLLEDGDISVAKRFSESIQVKDFAVLRHDTFILLVFPLLLPSLINTAAVIFGNSIYYYYTIYTLFNFVPLFLPTTTF